MSFFFVLSNPIVLQHAETILDLYSLDLGANMLAEHASMWIVTSTLLMTSAFPSIIVGPTDLSPPKIGLDFLIQVLTYVSILFSYNLFSFCHQV